ARNVSAAPVAIVQFAGRSAFGFEYGVDSSSGRNRCGARRGTECRRHSRGDGNWNRNWPVGVGWKRGRTVFGGDCGWPKYDHTDSPIAADLVPGRAHTVFADGAA